MTVKYCAQIKQAIGIASEVVELEGDCSAQELITRLAQQHGEPVRSFLLDREGRHRTNNLLIVGDEQVQWATPRPLEDGDEVTVLPPISGGSLRAWERARERVRVRVRVRK